MRTAGTYGGKRPTSLPSGWSAAEWRTAVAACVALAATLLVWLVPQIHVAYRSTELHVAFETVSAIVGLLAAAFVVGRYAESRQLADAAIASGLTTLACTSVVGAVGAVTRSGHLGWSILAGSFAGAVQLAFAAAAGDRKLRSQHGSRAAVVVAVAGYGLTVLALRLFDGRLPAPRAAAAAPGGEPQLSLSGHPVALALTFASTILFAAAAVGLTAASHRREGPLFGWLGAALALGAGARVNYLLFPSRASSWIFLGDVLRIASYLVLLGAVLAELREALRRAGLARALEERRQLARELHDGLAQELAYVLQQSRAGGDHRLDAAAQRALDESRRVIAVLTGPLDEPFQETLERVAAHAAERAGLDLRLAVADGVSVEPESRELLLRVVREGIDNAARHGQAGTVEVSCVRNGVLHLAVIDDGVGGPGVRDGALGFALQRLSEAAAVHGGTLALHPRAPRGSVLEVTIP